MKKEIIISYLYDFLSDLMNSLNNKKINQIILFGSVAKDDFDKESDIDIFIDTEEDIEKEYKNALFNFEKRSERTWKLKEIDFPINSIRDNLKKEKWDNLRQEISSNGIILYGRYKKELKELEHKIMITYSIKKLNSNKKMKIIRILNGYKNIKNKKVYIQKGLIEKTNSKKIDTNSIIIKYDYLNDFKKIFKDNKVSYTIKEIWEEIK
jgi:predicted nucleotidyltransferase